MTDRIKTAFDGILAEDKLKSTTLTFLHNEINNRNKIKNRVVFKRLSVALASVVIILLSSVFSYNLYFTPVAYIDVDVNPSIELSINRFNRVIEAYPYNDDGAFILYDVNVRHKTYDDVLKILLDEMINRGYLTSDGLVSVTVQAGDVSIENKILSNLQTTVSVSLTNNHCTAETDFFTVSNEIRNHAHGYNVSPAKYIAITQLQEVDPTITFEDCAGHSLIEIRQFTKEHGNFHHEQSNKEYDKSDIEDDYKGKSHHDGHNDGKH